MFQYFWEDLSFLWKEETFDSLFKLLAKRDVGDYLSFLYKSKTTHAIFDALSYQYKFSFIEHILQTKHDILDEITSMVTNGEDIGQDDPEQFLYEKKSSIDHFFIQVYEELS